MTVNPRRSLILIGVTLALINAPEATAKTSAADRVLGVLPIVNSSLARPDVRPAPTSMVATEIVKSLRGYEGLSVVSLAQAELVLGKESAEALAGCESDGCRIEILRPLNLDLFVHGELIQAGRGQRLRLRLVSTSSVDMAGMVVTADVAVPDRRLASLRVAVLDAIGALFSDLGLQGYGQLRIETEPEAATVTLNGDVVGESPVGPIRLPTGAHRLTISHAGHRPWDGSVTINLGEDAIVTVELEKKRRPPPAYLAASAISVAVTGAIFGLHAAQVADEWTDTCVSGHCAPGFTAQRHRDETGRVDVERTVANALFATALGLGISAITAYILDEGESEDAQ